MRVLLWTDSDRFAGTERHCVELAAGLRDLGVAVSMGCRPSSPLEQEAKSEGIPTLATPHAGGRLGEASKLSALIGAGAVDLVHAHNGWCTLLACLAVRHAGRGQVVATQHFINPARTARRGFLRWVSKGIHRWTGRRVSRWIAISEAVASSMNGRGDADPARVRCIPNGVRGPLQSELDATESRELLGLRHGVPVLLCAARLEPEKGHDVFLRALAMLANEGLDFQVVCVGGGSLEPRLRQQVLEMGLGGSVRVTGHQPDIDAWLSASDVLVLPSPAEPFGLVLLEAMRRKVPVVASSAGGPLEIVTPESGVLFHPGDARDLATRLRALLKSEELRVRLGTGGFQRWRAQFDATRMAQRVLAVYGEALLESARPAHTRDAFSKFRSRVPR